jgi:dihydrofolate reductase
MSLDGYIADSNGGADWIVSDPEIDFAAMFEQFDTYLMGRHTFEYMVRHGYSAEDMEGRGFAPLKGKIFVFSRSLRASDYPDVQIVATDQEKTVQSLREQPGKDIWLFGGGELFRSLLAANLVDTVEIAIIPVLLGAGIPMLPNLQRHTSLTLARHTVYKKSGIVALEYAVERT